jgi:hypothetical protein
MAFIKGSTRPKFDPSTMDEPLAVDAAWAAGVVEGEGCIRLQVSDVTDTRSGKRIKNRVTMSVSVSMKDAAVVARLYELFGGWTATRPDGLAAVTWSSNRAAWVLARLLPYMRGDKKPQAELAIEFQTGRLPGHRAKARHPWELDAAVRISEMKKIGVYQTRKGPAGTLRERIANG